MHPPIRLFVRDPAFLSSLQFALSVEGFEVEDGWSEAGSPPACLVIDQAGEGEGLSLLADLRAKGCTAPAILLMTHPTSRQRARAAALGAGIIEKPLFGDALTGLLGRMLECSEAA